MAKMSVIRFNRDGPEQTGLTFWGHLESENVIEGDPTEIGHNYFADSTGQLTAGVWECTPCTSRIDSYPVDEFCFILSGTVVVTDAEGHAETFKPGDSFVIPKGLKCTWHMPETTRKYYVIFDAAAAGP
ncbi:MAG: cupin domain-containing protein [Kiloniellales bacterium]